jgi:hypothetical protein
MVRLSIKGRPITIPLGLASLSSGPDVSADADPETGYVVFVDGGQSFGGWNVFGGTSASAPLWAGAKLAKSSKPKPVLVAAGHLTFPGTTSGTIKLKLTAAGKALFKRAKQLKLTAKGTFTPTGKAPVSSTTTFALKR